MNVEQYWKLTKDQRDKMNTWMQQITGLLAEDLLAKNVVVEGDTVVFECLRGDGSAVVRTFPLTHPWPL